MGLDQYAYAAMRAGQRDDWWEGAEMDADTKEYVNPNLTRPRQLMYWRKHPNLQGLDATALGVAWSPRSGQ